MAIKLAAEGLPKDWTFVPVGRTSVTVVVAVAFTEGFHLLLCHIKLQLVLDFLPFPGEPVVQGHHMDPK